MSIVDEVKKILQGIGTGARDVVDAFKYMDTISKRAQAGLDTKNVPWPTHLPTNSAPYQQPVPSVSPTVVPTPAPTQNTGQGGFHIPNVPDNIAQVIGQVMQNQGVPMDATASARILSHPYGPQILGQGMGENPNFQTTLDVANRIGTNGMWNDNAPIAQITNPFTGQQENSNDRGLWRINNETFYDYQRKYPEIFKKYGINSYADMNDPLKNTVVAKLILQHQGGSAFFAAPANMANFGLLSTAKQ